MGWVLQLIKELPAVSGEYFKKLQNTDDLWEVRAKLDNNAFRLLGFLDDGLLVILTNGFAKKSQKTPASEIDLDEQRKDLDLEFAKTFDEGYEQFKIGELLRYARERAGFTQEELAGKLNTKKSAISRIENHSEDIRLSTLFHYAEALGKKLQVSIQ